MAVTIGSLVGATAATALWFFLPPGKHIAYAKFLMPKNPPGLIYKHPEDLGQGQFEAFQQTQVALMRGRTVLNAALRNPEVLKINLRPLTKDTPAVEWLEKEVRVTTPEGPELPRLTMSGYNPEHLKVLLQAVVDAYMEEIVGVQKRHRQERLDTLKEISITYQKRLNRIVDARNEEAKLIGVGEERAIALKLEMGQKQVMLAQAELIKVDADLRRLELEEKVYNATIEKKGPTEVSDKLIEAYVERDLAHDMAIRDKLQARLTETRIYLENEQHPRIQNLLAEIASHKKAIAARREELRPTTRRSSRRK